MAGIFLLAGFDPLPKDSVSRLGAMHENTDSVDFSSQPGGKQESSDQ